MLSKSIEPVLRARNWHYNKGTFILSLVPDESLSSSMAAAAAPAAAPSASLYFANPAADWLMAGGASIALYVLLTLAGPPTRSAAVIALGGWLSWVINWPHFAATLWRLYHSRENVQRFPMTALLIPPVMTLAVVACFAYPESVAPAFCKLFLLWSPYHFSGQTVGLTLVYARRAGFEIGRFERLALSGFVFGTYVSGTAMAEASQSAYQYYGINIPPLGLPPFIGQAATWGMWACGAGLVTLVVHWCIKSRKVLPPVVLLPAFAQMTWFVFGSGTPSFYEFVPAFHGLQYLLVAWTMHVREKKESLAADGPVLEIGQLSAEWLLGNIAIGALLFWGLPRLLAGGQQGLQFSMPVVIAAVQIHHFFVDGVIWKLRDPKVGARLTAGLPEVAS